MVTRYREYHYIIMRGRIHQEDVTIANIFISSIGTLKYIKQKKTDMKGETDNNTIILRDFTILL